MYIYIVDVYVYTYTHKYIKIYTHKHIHTYIYMYVRSHPRTLSQCVCVCVCVCVPHLAHNVHILFWREYADQSLLHGRLDRIFDTCILNKLCVWDSIFNKIMCVWVFSWERERERERVCPWLPWPHFWHLDQIKCVWVVVCVRERGECVFICVCYCGVRTWMYDSPLWLS